MTARRQPAAVRIKSPARTSAPCAPSLRASIVRVLRAAQTQFLHAPRIGFDDFEIETGGMMDDLAALRHAAHQRGGETAQRIDFLVAFFRREHDAGLFLEILEIETRVGI